MELTKQQKSQFSDEMERMIKVCGGLESLTQSLLDLYFRYTIMLTDDTTKGLIEGTSDHLWTLSEVINILNNLKTLKS